MSGTASFFHDRDFWQQMRTVVLPISFQFLLFHAGTATDAMMLTKWSETALAGVSLAGQYLLVFGLIMTSCNYGMAIFVSQYWGKRDTRSIAKLLGMSFQINLFLALLFYPATILSPRTVMSFLTNSPELTDAGTEYLFWVGLSMFFMALTQGMTTVCTSTGYAKKILLITGETVFLDVFFNVVFIFGIGGYCRWGVKGAAIATVTVRAIGCLLTALELRREGNVRLKSLYVTHFAFSLFKHVAKYSLPIFGNVFLYGLGLVTGAVIIGHLGESAVAANSLNMAAKNLFSCFFAGISSGSSVIVGQALGAGDMARGRELGNRLLVFTLICGTVAAVLMPCSLPVIFHYGTELTAETRRYLVWMTFISMPYLVCGSCDGTLFRLLNTGGDSRFTFWCDFVTIVCIVLPASFLLAFVVKAPVLAVYAMIYSDAAIKLLPAFLRSRRYYWLRNLTRKEEVS